MLFLLSLLLSSPAIGAENPVCQSLELRPDRRFEIPEEVDYFIRASSRREITFASRQGNRLLNLTTGQTSAFPGLLDPVASPDGEIYTVPIKAEGSELNGAAAQYQMNFFRPSRQKGGPPEFLFRDEGLNQTYQSLGTLAKTKAGANYRLIYQENNQVMARDYAYDSRAAKITPLNQASPVCPSAPNPIALPMLSRDGREFSYYDAKLGRTFIYEIEELGKRCALKDEIPALVGKIDFSPSGKRLAFHADLRSDQSSMFWQPNAQYNLGLFAYDRATKTVVPLHAKPGEQAYFPVFLNENEIAYVTSPRGGTKSFTVNTARLESLVGCRDCLREEPARDAAALIGTLYAKACDKPRSFRLQPGVVTFLTLSANRCAALVELETDESLRNAAGRALPAERLANLSKASLLRVCQKLKGPGAVMSNPVEAPEPGVAPAK
ncbi:MAG: hypothetical protein EOP11_07555 [Proteobacteria bacterium]|nr:MAG: hypothetical protein EOP11_07555 [Pseudomonadota bacterium]